MPTHSLFIETMVDENSIVEEIYKEKQRELDTVKLATEAAKQQIDNLRRAGRLLNGERGDPDFEKQTIVAGLNASPSIEGKPVGPAGRRGHPMTANTDTADRFRAWVITRAFSRATEEIGDQLDFDHKYQHLFKSEYDAAIGLIVSVRTADTLVALMTVYLELYARYAANANAVHFYRSDQVFVELIERTVKVPVVRRDLFREWAAALDGTTKRTDVTSLKPRFDALSVTARSRIAVFVEAQRERRRKSSSILDTLRAAYLATSGSAAASDEALRDFDPYPGDTFRSWFASRFDRVSAAWNSATKYNEREHRAAFDTAFDGFGDYLAGLPRRDPLPLFEILKFLRDRLTPQRETRSWGTVTRPGDTRPFVPELYVAVCMQLLVVANRELSLPANRVGFTPDELGFFWVPLQRNTGGYGSWTSSTGSWPTPTRPLRSSPGPRPIWTSSC